MKLKNKIMRGLLAFCMAFTCVLGLAACGNDTTETPTTPATPATPAMTFTVSETVMDDANNVMADLKLIHNNFPMQDQPFELDDLTSHPAFIAYPDFADFTYYVKVGTVANVASVESITLGSEFVKDQTFELSIGKNCHLTAEVYYVEDNNLYIAAPIVVFEAVNLEKIKINDTEFAVEESLSATAGEVETAAFETSSSTIAPKADSENQYNVVVKEANNPILLGLENVTSDDFVVVKKVDGDVVSYAISEVRATDKLAVYPVPYSSEPLDEDYEVYNNTTREYYIYVLNGDIYTVILNITVELPTP